MISFLEQYYYLEQDFQIQIKKNCHPIKVIIYTTKLNIKLILELDPAIKN